MSNEYREQQIIKHALQYYIRRPNASELDKNVNKSVRKVTNEVKRMQKQWDIPIRSVVVMGELEVVSNHLSKDTFEVTKESASNLVSELQSRKFTIEDQQRELNKLNLIKREHAKWLSDKITVVQFAYNVEKILNNLEEQ